MAETSERAHSHRKKRKEKKTKKNEKEKRKRKKKRMQKIRAGAFKKFTENTVYLLTHSVH